MIFFFSKIVFHEGNFLEKIVRGKFNIFSMMCRWRRGELVVPGDKPAKEFSLERLGVGGN